DAWLVARSERRSPSAKAAQRTLQAEAEARARNPWLVTLGPEALEQLHELATRERSELPERLRFARPDYDRWRDFLDAVEVRYSVDPVAEQWLDRYLEAGRPEDAAELVQDLGSYWGFGEGNLGHLTDELFVRIASARALSGGGTFLRTALEANSETLVRL